MRKVKSDYAVKKILLLGLVAVLTAGFVAAQDAAIGTAQTSFVISDMAATFNKKAVAAQVHSRLLDVAQQKYAASESVDIRDVIWTGGKKVDHQNREITASCKVVRVAASSAANSYGMVQTSFVVESVKTWFGKKSVNTQAYIKLLEAAQQKFPNAIDVTDIVWRVTRSVENQNAEIFATGKIVQSK